MVSFTNAMRLLHASIVIIHLFVISAHMVSLTKAMRLLHASSVIVHLFVLFALMVMLSKLQAPNILLQTAAVVCPPRGPKGRQSEGPGSIRSINLKPCKRVCQVSKPGKSHHERCEYCCCHSTGTGLLWRGGELLCSAEAGVYVQAACLLSSFPLLCPASNGLGAKLAHTFLPAARAQFFLRGLFCDVISGCFWLPLLTCAVPRTVYLSWL
mmetsp:Transcript_67595/g.133410  ORF Transcript_67595/g.133410 Transcript_67595/m.133410 type:complete len:211 (+) Transcript_67595:556-1188(+)